MAGGSEGLAWPPVEKCNKGRSKRKPLWALTKKETPLIFFPFQPKEGQPSSGFPVFIQKLRFSLGKNCSNDSRADVELYLGLFLVALSTIVTDYIYTLDFRSHTHTDFDII